MLSFVEKLNKQVAKIFGRNQDQEDRSSSKDKMNNCFEGSSISSFLSYDLFDKETDLFINKKSIGFAIEMLPLVGSDNLTQKSMNSIFQDILEEGDSIQCLLWTDHRVDPFFDFWENPRKKKGGIYSKLAEKRLQTFRNNQQNFPSLFRFILSYTVQFDGDIEKSEHIISKLRTKKDKILMILRTLSPSARVWKPIDLLDVVGGMINFSRDTKSHTPNWNPFQSLSTQIPRGSSLEIQEGLLVNRSSDLSFKSFRVSDFPEFWSLQQMQNLIGDSERENFRLKCPFYIQFSVHCPVQSSVSQRYKAREKFVEKQGESSTFLKIIPQLADELKEIQYARKELYEGAKYVWTNLSVGIWTKSNEMIQQEEVLKAIFRNNRFTLIENHAFPLASFLSALPLNISDCVKGLKNMNFFRTTLNRECGVLIPIQGEWYGTLNSPGILLIGKRGQLANVNSFDNQTGNYNRRVVGRSGSGKSVLMQDLMLSDLSTGGRVFVLDVGRSFDKLCNLLDGQFIEFSSHSKICLNPFTKFPVDNEVELNDCIIMLKTILGNMADPINGLSSEQMSLVEEAIKEVWKARGTDSSITCISNWLKEHKEESARSIGRMLFPYTVDGVYGRYFEGKNNVNFNNSFVAIELEELKEKKDLQAVVLQLFMLNITDQTFMGDRKTRFSICVDEAWDLLRGKQTELFIETLARRLRKYNGSLTIGTQGEDDFNASPGAKAASANCDWVFYLPQEDKSIDYLKKQQGVSEGKIKAVQNLQTIHGSYSEVLVCLGKSYSTHRLILDPFSNLLYSTQPKDHIRIQELRKQGKKTEEAIEIMLEEKACRK